MRDSIPLLSVVRNATDCVASVYFQRLIAHTRSAIYTTLRWLLLAALAQQSCQM
jgi:hypothetical protein